jgi:hypothetical protein
MSVIGVNTTRPPIGIVIISAGMVVLAIIRIWFHFTDPSSFGRWFDAYSGGFSALILSAAVGLWRARRWGKTLYWTFAMYLVASGVVMIFAAPQESLMFVGMITVYMGIVFSFVGIYIHRVSKRSFS